MSPPAQFLPLGGKLKGLKKKKKKKKGSEELPFSVLASDGCGLAVSRRSPL